MESGQSHPQDRVREVASKVAPQIEAAREGLGELNVRLTTFIREQPGTCLLGALALGFVIGRIASR